MTVAKAANATPIQSGQRILLHARLRSLRLVSGWALRRRSPGVDQRHYILQATYEKRIKDRFEDQRELDLLLPTPSPTASPPPSWPAPPAVPV